ncbi:MAG: adenylosuccinate synthase, partial [Chloroflexi bacterium]|nr:adenylosuccinate synthase [Chloroflexota bacterium]
DRFAQGVGAALKRVNLELQRVFEAKAFTVEEIVAAYAPAAERMAPHVEDTALFVQRLLRDGKHVLLEGAQATMLDIDYGTYPYVTSSSPTAGGACQGSGISPVQVKEIVGVVKAYTSRVGKGPFPTELEDDLGHWIRERGREYGTTTGRPRRCGWVDVVSLRYAMRVNGYTGLALTRLDVLSGLNELKMCVAYRLPDGSVTEDYPLDTNVLGAAEAVYETMPGWEEDISGARMWEDLPETVRAYAQRLSELLGVPVDLLSVGAERNDLVALRWPI